MASIMQIKNGVGLELHATARCLSSNTRSEETDCQFIFKMKWEERLTTPPA